MNDIVQTQGGHLPQTREEMDSYFAAYADAYAQTERRAGSTVSVRNMVMSVSDQPIPGNQFAAIILDAVRLNTYYTSAYNPQNFEPPKCYAIGRNEAELAPHPDMQKDLSFFQPQADRCGACPHNEFGSARQGAGKACSNRRRLLMALAGVYEPGPQGLVLKPYTDIEHYASTPLLTMSLAPTTTPGWGAWIRDVAAQHRRPMFGVIARVFVYPHPKHGKEAIGFETLAPVPDEWVPTIIQRHQEAAREIMEGYEPPQPPQQRGGGFYQAQAGQQR